MPRSLSRETVSACLLGLALVLLAVLGIHTVSRGAGGAYPRTMHADPERGVRRLVTWPAGSCEQCHSEHGGDVNHDFSLFEEGNATCLASGCHDGAMLWPPGDYHRPWMGATGGWSLSAHGNAETPFPPIDGRPVSACAQCHDPHGVSEPAVGLFPSLTQQIEEQGCTSRPGAPDGGCHGLDPGWRPLGAKDLSSLFLRPYRHDLGLGTKLHTWDWSEAFPFGRESRAPLSGDFAGARRHVECVDCHNPHTARPGLHTPGENAAGPTLTGSWGVEPAFGPAGAIPTSFTVIDLDAGIGAEHQLCLRCHSYYAYGTTPPPSSTDQAREFNPANPSFHPVVSEIPENSYTSPTAVNGMTETMLPPWNNGRHDRMTCSDCHAGDDPDGARGPHGSFVEGLLPEPAGEEDNGFCLRCHAPEVYAPALDPDAKETGSRFDAQTTGVEEASHYTHVVENRIGCRACHGGSSGGAGPLSRGSLHGSDHFPGLMNGTQIQNYEPGGCTPVCHEAVVTTAGPE